MKLTGLQAFRVSHVQTTMFRKCEQANCKCQFCISPYAESYDTLATFSWCQSSHPPQSARTSTLTTPPLSGVRKKMWFSAVSSQLLDCLTHHNLNLKFADLQIVLIVDIHSFQCTAQALMSPHQKNYGKASCKWVERSRRGQVNEHIHISKVQHQINTLWSRITMLKYPVPLHFWTFSYSSHTHTHIFNFTFHCSDCQVLLCCSSPAV